MLMVYSIDPRWNILHSINVLTVYRARLWFRSSWSNPNLLGLLFIVHVTSIRLWKIYLPLWYLAKRIILVPHDKWNVARQVKQVLVVQHRCLPFTFTQPFWCGGRNIVGLDLYQPAVSTVKPVYNDHPMGYFSAFWSSSMWPRAT